MPDRLVKQLHAYLGRSVAQEHVTWSWFREAGWFDFLRQDRPETDDPVEMACEAFVCLAMRDGGLARDPKPILAAVVAFLAQHTRIWPAADQLRELKAILDAEPCPPDEIRKWSRAVYRQR